MHGINCVCSNLQIAQILPPLQFFILYKRPNFHSVRGPLWWFKLLLAKFFCLNFLFRKLFDKWCVWTIEHRPFPIPSPVSHIVDSNLDWLLVLIRIWGTLILKHFYAPRTLGRLCSTYLPINQPIVILPIFIDRSHLNIHLNPKNTW